MSSEAVAPVAGGVPELDEKMRQFLATKSQAALADLVEAVTGEPAAAALLLQKALELIHEKLGPQTYEDIYKNHKRTGSFSSEQGAKQARHEEDGGGGAGAEESEEVSLDYFKNDDIDREERTLLLMVPDNAVSTIIGPSGGTIKQIQTSSTTKIDIQTSAQMVPGQHERRVSITGTIKNTNIAQYLVNMKVAEKLKVDTPVGMPVQMKVKVLVPTVSVSFLIGKQGATVSEIQHTSGTKIQIEKEQEMLPGLGGRLVIITSGDQRGRLLSQYLVSRTICQHEKMSSPAGSGAYPAINGGLDMYVPNHLIARLIGKQGKCVSELQSQSGARIQIQRENEMKPGQKERLVTLGGSQDSIKACQSLITRMVAEWERADATGEMPSRGHHGGGGRYQQAAPPYPGHAQAAPPGYPGTAAPAYPGYAAAPPAYPAAAPAYPGTAQQQQYAQYYAQYAQHQQQYQHQ